MIRMNKVSFSVVDETLRTDRIDANRIISPIKDSKVLGGVRFPNEYFVVLFVATVIEHVF